MLPKFETREVTVKMKSMSSLPTRPKEAGKSKCQKARILSEDRLERSARLRGCGCSRCDPHLVSYTVQLPKLHIFGGLKWNHHDAWQLAEFAVSSFDGKDASSILSVAMWTQWYERIKGMNDPWIVDSTLMTQAMDIFDRIFFQRTVCAKLNVVRAGVSDFLGRTYYSSEHAKEVIEINRGNPSVLGSREFSLCVLLHEMAHAYLTRYTAVPSAGVRSKVEMHWRSYTIQYGCSGHGRGWHFLVKAIEDNMLRLLGFRGQLGRHDGMAEELRQGGTLPCVSDIRQLYKWRAFPARHFWTVRGGSKDDFLPELFPARCQRCGRSRNCCQSLRPRRYTDSERGCTIRKTFLNDLPDFPANILKWMNWSS